MSAMNRYDSREPMTASTESFEQMAPVESFHGMAPTPDPHVDDGVWKRLWRRSKTGRHVVFAIIASALHIFGVVTDSLQASAYNRCVFDWMIVISECGFLTDYSWLGWKRFFLSVGPSSRRLLWPLRALILLAFPNWQTWYARRCKEGEIRKRRWRELKASIGSKKRQRVVLLFGRGSQ